MHSKNDDVDEQVFYKFLDGVAFDGEKRWSMDDVIYDEKRWLGESFRCMPARGFRVLKKKHVKKGGLIFAIAVQFEEKRGLTAKVTT